MQCPFCHSEKDAQAPVCASCGRDTAVPEALLAERADLLHKRDKLRAEVEKAQARLSAKRARLSRSRRA
jgi:thioredoxin reductase